MKSRETGLTKSFDNGVHLTSCRIELTNLSGNYKFGGGETVMGQVKCDLVEI